MTMSTAKGIKLGCDWENIYFIQYSFDLDLKFEGSQEYRVKQFENYLIPIVRPFVKYYGLNDYNNPTEEDLKECLKWLEGDFTQCDTLAKWCEMMGYKALCYWDLEKEATDNYVRCPIWLS